VRRRYNVQPNDSESEELHDTQLRYIDIGTDGKSFFGNIMTDVTDVAYDH